MGKVRSGAEPVAAYCAAVATGLEGREKDPRALTQLRAKDLACKAQGLQCSGV